MLKRTVSLNTYNLPMIWLDPHLYEKGSFYAHTLPATEGGIQWRGGGGGTILVRIPSVLVMGGIGHQQSRGARHFLCAYHMNQA